MGTVASPAPVLLIVGGDPGDVGTTASALVVAADLHLTDGDGVEFLERAAGLHRGVARILLFDLDEFHTRIPFRELPALQRASALGRIDGWMVKGWVNPEEWLYPQVQEALSAWSTAHQPGHVVYRMIDLEWDRRSHDLRDALTVNGVPFAFHTKDSDSGRQLIRNHRVDGTRLPALIRHDGTVLQQPSMAEMPAAAATQPNTFCISGQDGCRLDAVGVRTVAGKAQPFAARHARGSE